MLSDLFRTLRDFSKLVQDWARLLKTRLRLLMTLPDFIWILSDYIETVNHSSMCKTPWDQFQTLRDSFIQTSLKLSRIVRSSFKTVSEYSGLLKTYKNSFKVDYNPSSLYLTILVDFSKLVHSRYIYKKIYMKRGWLYLHSKKRNSYDLLMPDVSTYSAFTVTLLIIPAVFVKSEPRHS